jgi:regulator of sigma E protease
MLSALIFILVLSVLIVIHEFGHFIMARSCGVRVEKFSLGFGPRVVGIKRGDTEYMISAIPLGGYVKLAGESHHDEVKGEPWEFLSKPPGDRFKIIAFGPFLNYVLGFLLFSVVFMMGSPTLTNKVGKVPEGYPAKEAGVMAGDRIVAVDGKEVKYWHELTDIIHKKMEGAVDLDILRKGEIISMTMPPRISEYKDIFGKKTKIAQVGIAPSDELLYIKYHPVESLRMGGKKIIELTGLTFRAIWNLIIGRMRLKESVTGPVGIFVLTARAARLGPVYLLNIMAIISTSLAIFNVLPIPVLDGGHMIFLAIEKVTRRPVSVKVQEVLTQIGLGVLILLMLFVFYYDIMRLMGR